MSLASNPSFDHSKRGTQHLREHINTTQTLSPKASTLQSPATANQRKRPFSRIIDVPTKQSKRPFSSPSDLTQSLTQQRSIRPAPVGIGIWKPDSDALDKTSTEVSSDRDPERACRNRRPHQSAGHSASILGGKVKAPTTSSDGSKHLDIKLQPETRPISQEQLVAEVKGIYAGLVMAETKCIEVDNKHTPEPESLSKMNHEQWQALIGLHRTLLHEHHDFFLASQHPSASPALRRLASKYAMPARMWRHGIHSFLELLRHRLPASQDHMLAFIYLAYSMMALLYETVPAFEDTWIECLGDLGRYRMAIEDDDIRDREVWTGVARHWYSKASDKAPTTGRLYHHLAILARPNALQQLFYYAKSLCVLRPFTSARESILTLFEPILNPKIRLNQHLEGLEKGIDGFIGQLDNGIGCISRKFAAQGYFVAVANSIALRGLDEFSPSILSKSFEDAQELSSRTLEVVLRRLGDPNELPFMHAALVFMYNLSRAEGTMEKSKFPWHLLAVMLDNLMRPPISLKHLESKKLYIPEDDQRPFPENFALRGLRWTDNFPENWFLDAKADDEELYLDLSPTAAQRKIYLTSARESILTLLDPIRKGTTTVIHYLRRLQYCNRLIHTRVFGLLALSFVQPVTAHDTSTVDTIEQANIILNALGLPSLGDLGFSTFVLLATTILFQMAIRSDSQSRWLGYASLFATSILLLVMPRIEESKLLSLWIACAVLVFAYGHEDAKRLHKGRYYAAFEFLTTALINTSAMLLFNPVNTADKIRFFLVGLIPSAAMTIFFVGTLATGLRWEAPRQPKPSNATAEQPRNHHVAAACDVLVHRRTLGDQDGFNALNDIERGGE